MICRAPHGARGLKHDANTAFRKRSKSRPAWGAWIETHRPMLDLGLRRCRAPHGARGLKHRASSPGCRDRGRAPHGARGLKLTRLVNAGGQERRAPHGARGLKHGQRHGLLRGRRSRPAWGAWIETRWATRGTSSWQWSRPAWGAWIETLGMVQGRAWRLVAPRMGRVD